MAQAQLVNSFKTYSAVGNREDLSNVIYNIAPSDTPVLTAIGSESATSTKHEWQTDSLAAPAENAQVEGFEADIEKSTPTERLYNYTQIFSKTVAVSETQETVDKAGRSSEMAYQTAKRMKEIKLDMEFAILSNTASSAGSSSDSAATARKLGGFPAWLETNSSYGAGGKAGSDGSTAAIAGTKRQMSEDFLTTVLTSIYENGGKMRSMYVAPDMKGFISKNFGGTGDKVTTYRKEESKTAGVVVEVYQSDFGLVDIVPNRVMAATSLKNFIYIIDPAYASIAWLRRLGRKPLADTGDNKKALMTAEMTLTVRNEKAHGIIGDVQTTTASSGG
jgi:hypothetical protein